MTITEIISVVGTVGCLIAAIIAVCQYSRECKLKRADLFNSMVEKLRSDPDIQKWMLIFDYNKPWYCKEFHNSCSQQIGVDKTLQTLSYFCYLKKQKLISEKEFSTIKYELWQTLSNHEVQSYLFNLYHFSSRKYSQRNEKDMIIFPFCDLLKYGVANHLIDDSFFDRSSIKFPNYLNY